MTKIFISYKSEERALPEALANDLRAAGYTVWWDVELVGGPAFRQQILAKLNAAQAVIVIWTPLSVHSEFVLDEADHAKRDGKLIPVRVPELHTRNIPLGHRQAQTYLVGERHRIIGALAALGVLPAQNPVSAAALPATGADERLWAEVRGEDSLEGYHYYLRKFPQGAHAVEADDAVWQMCGHQDDLAAYRRYLEILPEGEHSAVAEYRAERLMVREHAAARERYRAEGRIEVDAPFVTNDHGRWFLPGAGKTESFKDFEDGPEMVVVPAGEFLMGTAEDEIAALTKNYGDYFKREGPQHRVTIPKPFAIGKYAVTRGQFGRFVQESGHKIEGGAYVWTGSEWKLDPSKSWRDPGFAQDDQHPVVCISWDDATAYAAWLSERTGKDYGLPSEAEWEYVCRAGTVTPFWWGPLISTAQANFNGNHTFGGGPKGEWRQKTMPVHSFEANPWGLYQVHGNVWEWCEDVWHDTYQGAPSDGSSWTTGDGGPHVLRGGSWNVNPNGLRSACRYRGSSGVRYAFIGFRVARTLTP